MLGSAAKLCVFELNADHHDFRKMLLSRRFDIDESLADGTFNYTAMTDGERISLILLNRLEEEMEVCVEHLKKGKEYINISNVECGNGEGTLRLTLSGNTIMI